MTRKLRTWPYVVGASAIGIMTWVVPTALAEPASPYPAPPTPTTIPVARGECDAAGANGNLDEGGEVESVTVFLNCQVATERSELFTWTVGADEEAELVILVAVLELLGIVDGGDDEFTPHD